MFTVKVFQGDVADCFCDLVQRVFSPCLSDYTDVHGAAVLIQGILCRNANSALISTSGSSCFEK